MESSALDWGWEDRQTEEQREEELWTLVSAMLCLKQGAGLSRWSSRISSRSLQAAKEND